jgi:hypothetical protein
LQRITQELELQGINSSESYCNEVALDWQHIIRTFPCLPSPTNEDELKLFVAVLRSSIVKVLFTD